MFPCCNPKLYWIPKNPMFMFTICPKLIFGFGTLDMLAIDGASFA
jgi:hypothetical protein